jgi:penicillin-binding protein 1A
LKGASTITHQVARNFFLSKDQTISLNVKEAILTLCIERPYSKDNIIELYLNQIPFGMRAFGVASAALAYYGKPVGELRVADAAYLAALPEAPYNYDPYKDTHAALVRRDWVIDRMAENR